MVTLSDARLSEELNARGLTAGELARIAGISEITLSAARRGRRRLRPDSYARLVSALERTPRLGLDLAEKASRRRLKKKAETPTATVSASEDVTGALDDGLGGASTDVQPG